MEVFSRYRIDVVKLSHHISLAIFQLLRVTGHTELPTSGPWQCQAPCRH